LQILVLYRIVLWQLFVSLYSVGEYCRLTGACY